LQINAICNIYLSNGIICILNIIPIKKYNEGPESFDILNLMNRTNLTLA